MTIIYCPELFPQRPSFVVRKYGKKIAERRNIDSRLIANELGISERLVISIQRKLGLRPCYNRNGDD